MSASELTPPAANDWDPEALDTDEMILQMGPQHPATHGVLRLVCELDGETVVKCTPHIGYLHSSFEKLGEYRTWNQIVPLTDRMDYLAPLIYNCAFVMSVEAMMGIEVTERCKLTRVIMMELDRIFGHLLWLGTFAMDIGAFTPFLYTFEEREKIYTLHDQYTGARITTSATRIGTPPCWSTTISRTSSSVRMRPSERTSSVSSPSIMRPAPSLRLFVASAAPSISGSMPRAA